MTGSLYYITYIKVKLHIENYQEADGYVFIIIP